GAGYVTERVEGETLAGRILRDDRYAHARSIMTQQCGEILATIHRIPLTDAPFLKRFDPNQLVAAQRKILEFRGLHLPALEWGLRWAAENTPKNARFTAVHGDFRLGNFIVDEKEGIRLLL